jgi:hypothetical protein
MREDLDRSELEKRIENISGKKAIRHDSKDGKATIYVLGDYATIRADGAPHLLEAIDVLGDFGFDVITMKLNQICNAGLRKMRITRPEKK